MNPTTYYYEIIIPKLKKFFETIDIRKKKTPASPMGKIEPIIVNESGTFSHRMGIEDEEKQIQTRSMNNDLKNGLWNVAVLYFFPNVDNPYVIPIRENKEFYLFTEKLWLEFFKYPSEYILYGYIGNAINELRNAYMDLKWNEVYDFMEFVIKNYGSMTLKPKSDFISSCNDILERESSYYRIINDKLVPKYYGL
ncbi:MAG: AbiJ-NTD4 domain-containing protein [Nitrosotalea sp.]